MIKALQETYLQPKLWPASKATWQNANQNAEHAGCKKFLHTKTNV